MVEYRYRLAEQAEFHRSDAHRNHNVSAESNISVLEDFLAVFRSRRRVAFSCPLRTVPKTKRGTEKFQRGSGPNTDREVKRMQSIITENVPASTATSSEPDLIGLLSADSRIRSVVMVRVSETGREEQHENSTKSKVPSSLTSSQSEEIFLLRDLLRDAEYMVGLGMSSLELVFQLDGRWVIVTAKPESDILAIADTVIDQFEDARAQYAQFRA